MFEIFKPLLVNFWALFFTIDILGTLPIFISLTANYSRPFQKKMAFKAPLTAFVILLIFSLTGNSILKSFGLSLPAFKIAGGILLLLLSIEMVVAKPEPQMKSTNDAEKEENERRNDISVFPLAIPLLAGPAAITILILLMKEYEGQILNQFMIILALFLNMFLCWIAFKYATLIARFLGHSGINVLTRIFGILLTALACQFFIDGISEAFHLA
ncbi:MAG: MarC family protein [Candidatus Gastranaerophilaceae bacterium]